MAIKVTSKEFNELINKKEITLIDFYADWCGPCRALAPVLEEISNMNNNYSIGKVNVDDERELATKFNVRSIPTLIFFKEGKEIDRVVGYIPKEEILVKLNK